MQTSLFQDVFLNYRFSHSKESTDIFPEYPENASEIKFVRLFHIKKGANFTLNMTKNDLRTWLSAMRDLLTFTSDHQQMQQYQQDSTLPAQVSGTDSTSHPCRLLVLR